MVFMDFETDVFIAKILVDQLTGKWFLMDYGTDVFMCNATSSPGTTIAHLRVNKYSHWTVMYDSYLLKDVHSVLVNFPREYAQESMMLYI